jgi:hypothetical protein
VTFTLPVVCTSFTWTLTVLFWNLKKPVVTYRKAGENLPESKAKDCKYARRTAYI